jgi:hypothetical protein
MGERFATTILTRDRLRSGEMPPGNADMCWTTSQDINFPTANSRITTGSPWGKKAVARHAWGCNVDRTSQIATRNYPYRHPNINNAPSVLFVSGALNKHEHDREATVALRGPPEHPELGIADAD